MAPIGTGDVKPSPHTWRELFWDCDVSPDSWESHRSFVIRRVLTDGTWEQVCWLRRAIGDRAIRDWIVEHRGRSLSAQQIRFWELILELPAAAVDAWLSDPMRRLWWDRHKR
jgi:hypothetical protein